MPNRVNTIASHPHFQKNKKEIVIAWISITPCNCLTPHITYEPQSYQKGFQKDWTSTYKKPNTDSDENTERHRLYISSGALLKKASAQSQKHGSEFEFGKRIRQGTT